MKIGDLVQLSWGEHPRRAGVIIGLRRRKGMGIETASARVMWFINDRGPVGENYMLKSLELLSESR
jgi:hypothetical protein